LTLSAENKALIERQGPVVHPVRQMVDNPYWTDADLNRLLNAAREEGRIEGYAQCVEDNLGSYMAENP
jgi:hypothetical protein